MNLGSFSVSLAVKDLAASREFYEKLGFVAAGGNDQDNWLVMRNAGHTIGLFQGMFDRNILTFNPGWGETAEPVDPFTDIREIQRELKARGVRLSKEVDTDGSGPGHIMLADPDGNSLLIDQHR